MLNLEEGKKAAQFARENVEMFVKNKKTSSIMQVGLALNTILLM